MGAGGSASMPPGPPSAASPGEQSLPGAGPTLNLPTMPDVSHLGRAQLGGDQVLIMDEGGSQLVNRGELQRLREEAEQNAEKEGEHGAAADQIRDEIEQLQQERENVGYGERVESESAENGEGSAPAEEHGEEAGEASPEEESSGESSEESGESFEEESVQSSPESEASEGGGS